MALPLAHKVEIVDYQASFLQEIHDSTRKSELGQYMTPPGIARFMVSLFDVTRLKDVRLLDPGAGLGSLSSAFLDACINLSQKISLDLYAFELDPFFCERLEKTFQVYHDKIALRGASFSHQIFGGDFIQNAVELISSKNALKFTHAILNPPYKKIHSQSEHREHLRTVGVEAVNLYSAFVALALHLLADGGELVAIIPRSFCNGSYYKRFREFVFKNASIKQIHLFESRNSAFKEDDVLQENIIMHLIKKGAQGRVRLSFSNDESFSDFSSYECSFEDILNSDDHECFIRIPAKPTEDKKPEHLSSIKFSLSEIGVEVSTGPVVDFRLREFLCDQPELGSVPLLYPSHFVDKTIVWPAVGKKPNAIGETPETDKWLWPNGFYVVVRRLSSKEEKRRIIASIVDPAYFNYSKIAFENHLNVFHFDKRGLDEDLAHGLTCFLNSSFVDEVFRSFNGHTQVNATDLRALKYPDRKALIDLGLWAKEYSTQTDESIDKKIKEIR